MFPITCGRYLSRAVLQVVYYPLTVLPPTFSCRLRSISIGLTVLRAICEIGHCHLYSLVGVVGAAHGYRVQLDFRIRVVVAGSYTRFSIPTVGFRDVGDVALRYVVLCYVSSSRTRRHLPVGDCIHAGFFVKRRMSSPRTASPFSEL